MSEHDKSVVVAIFDGEGIAEDAALKLQDWDKASEAVQLGAMSIMYAKDGRVETRKMGGRKAGKGAKWGAIAGVVAGVLSGGITLIGGLIVGAAGGGLLGSLKKAGASISDEHIAQINKAIEDGKSALIVMCDEDEMAATSDQLTALGGVVRSFAVPAEAMAVLEATPEVQAAATDEQVADADGGEKPAQ
jgi:uncharacterized membrane protein